MCKNSLILKRKCFKFKLRYLCVKLTSKILIKQQK